MFVNILALDTVSKNAVGFDFARQPIVTVDSKPETLISLFAHEAIDPKELSYRWLCHAGGQEISFDLAVWGNNIALVTRTAPISTSNKH